MEKSAQHYRMVEILGVLITGGSKFIFMDWLNWKLPFIFLAIGFWVGYIFFRVRKDKSVLAKWGFTRQNLRSSFIVVSVFAFIGILSFIIYGSVTGKILWSWSVVPLMLLYPFWGIIQQFLILSLFSGNLDDLPNVNMPRWLLVVMTAVLFGILHYPIGLLIIGTTVLALFYTIVFLKYRNLWPLGLYHGILGALFYYLALGIDQFHEVFFFF
ncbi:MAG: CPBP family glutamic-type intramembrane protease [Bacteroidota bacterium]